MAHPSRNALALRKHAKELLIRAHDLVSAFNSYGDGVDRDIYELRLKLMVFELQKTIEKITQSETQFMPCTNKSD